MAIELAAVEKPGGRIAPIRHRTASDHLSQEVVLSGLKNSQRTFSGTSQPLASLPKKKRDLATTRRQERSMKMDPENIERTLQQVEAVALPENHPAIPKLTDLYGEHSFFLDNSGLMIVEPAESDDPGARKGQVVKLAAWSNAERTSLAPHPPQTTEVLVVLDQAA
jgi:hypothetical protein